MKDNIYRLFLFIAFQILVITQVSTSTTSPTQYCKTSSSDTDKVDFIRAIITDVSLPFFISIIKGANLYLYYQNFQKLRISFTFNQIQSSSQMLARKISSTAHNRKLSQDEYSKAILSDIEDPTNFGRYAIKSFVEKFKNKLTGHTLRAHVIYPDNVQERFPVIIIAHGFKLPSSQYYSYGIKLATFGFISVIIGYHNSFLGNDNIAQAKDLSSALNWAFNHKGLKNIIDANQSGIMGHSLGGKLSLLAATLDFRFKAIFCIDPVDGMGILVRNELNKLGNRPTGYIGELIDSSGRIKACAPVNLNYETLYHASPNPSFKVTVNGANHFSFLDDADNLWILKRFCKTAQVSSNIVRQLTQTYMVSFFQRHLRSIKQYDEWITGKYAQKEFILNGLASVTHK